MTQPNETAIEVPTAGLLIHLPNATDPESYQKFYQELSQTSVEQVRDLAVCFPITLTGHASLLSWQAMPRYIALTIGNTVVEWFEQLENSTKQPEYPENIEQQVGAVFEEALDENFEDGMENAFSRQLPFLVQRYGVSAMSEISYLITYERINSEVASEALRWLGRINDPPTYNYRLWLLEKGLGSTSARVRDGAALGLASIGDPDAIPHLKRAIDREKCTDLREDLVQVLTELEAAHRAAFAEDK